jgi:hypothetical protein
MVRRKMTLKICSTAQSYGRRLSSKTASFRAETVLFENRQINCRTVIAGLASRISLIFVTHGWLETSVKGMETPVAFLLDGAVAVRVPTAKPPRLWSVDWTRAAALGLNVLLWAVIALVAHHFLVRLR